MEQIGDLPNADTGWKLDDRGQQTAERAYLVMGQSSSDSDWGSLIITGPRAQERARLIMAHDELVAALEKIEQWKFNFMGDCVAEARNVARAALAKIKGV